MLSAPTLFKGRTENSPKKPEDNAVVRYASR